ncbi:two-component sensor histidine kinase [Clostridium sporogenes]|uniref:sensor histidine kinase n=1 Tax=Clostridium TaxID=1485 RepID=UPI00077FF29A|nr:MULTISPECIES: sensor histidine kinase [Clostridium]KYN78301.1 two-component sensor histidine kinase [Clostridium sporogenes]MBA4506861.1 sensor histidine kinase [Clostridium sporogenes]MBE6056694.1 sensor histidine kinase [Clostridium sp.]MDU6335830.1 sensor histidine kinase [Clostridium sporogenes]NFM17166.1 sensor histidine kinase [Clostridium sporogenes]
MERKRLLIIVRYIAILFLIFGIASFEKENITTYTVILILLFIINNQIRFFIFNENKKIVFMSIILECSLAYIGYTNYSGILFFYFFTDILDSALFLKGKSSYLTCFIVLIVVIFLGWNLNLTEILSVVASLVMLFILANYIKEENSAKLRAQKLYDKLRISEEKLKKANRDLESYANSIEELTVLRERNRISREIHDSVGHSLSTMIIQLGAIEKIAEKDGKLTSEMARKLGEFAKNSLGEVRCAVRALKPREFEKYEGILAVEELTKNFEKLTGVKVKLGFSKEKWTLNSDQCFVLYRVVQEFLSNSLRHGKATRVDIFMGFNEENLIITLRDNGQGSDKIEKGVGLKGIWERVNELGGTVAYNSKKEEGFLLKVVLYPQINET